MTQFNLVDIWRIFQLNSSFSECPNYNLVIPSLLADGTANLHKTCKLTPGIPLKPMLAHPTKGIQEVLTRFENMKFTCEWKYDGERAQIHLHDDGKITIYSRNQEENTTKYPDIIERFKKCVADSGDKLKSCVLDTEAVAWDREKEQILPFQASFNFTSLNSNCLLQFSSNLTGLIIACRF
jgi:DNA ligase-1